MKATVNGATVEGYFCNDPSNFDNDKKTASALGGSLTEYCANSVKVFVSAVVIAIAAIS